MKKNSISYVEIGLSNGARWRIDYKTLNVIEVEEVGGMIYVTGPITIKEFIHQLETAKEKQ